MKYIFELSMGMSLFEKTCLGTFRVVISSHNS
jgi:hypothetical protein